MKKCEQCGNEFNDDYSYCPTCGGQLSEEKPKNNVCPNCGAELTDGFVYCPECGTNVATGDRDSKDEVNNLDRLSNEKNSGAPSISSPSQTQPKAKSNNKKIFAIVGAVLGIAIIALIIHMGSSSITPLVLNSGEDINIYVDEKETVSVEGEGLTESDYDSIVWSTDNEAVLTVNENGEIEAHYDSASFNELEEGEEEADICSCSTTVRASLQKDKQSWSGSAPVHITIAKKEFESGKVIIEPEGSRDSALTVNAPDDTDVYIYLESKTDSSNNMSFTVGAGKEETFSVPMDDYELYWAQGNTWYGEKFKFGPDTTYQKTSEDWDFTQETWIFKMATENGNLGSESIDEDDFPGQE